MDKIEWSDKFSVGVKLFDDQHRQLVGMINKLIDTPGLRTNSAIVTEMLAAMIEYATTHFESEEQLMKEHDYPGLERQRTEHSEFIAKTAEFCAEGRMQVDGIPESILIYLREWWINHILIDDMRYKQFFDDKELSE